MKYIQSQSGNQVYQCLGVSKDVINYSDRKIYKINVTHGYGSEEYYIEMARYSNEEKLNIVFNSIIVFLNNDKTIFQCPSDGDVREPDYSVFM